MYLSSNLNFVNLKTHPIFEVIIITEAKKESSAGSHLHHHHHHHLTIIVFDIHLCCCILYFFILHPHIYTCIYLIYYLEREREITYCVIVLSGGHMIIIILCMCILCKYVFVIFPILFISP